MVNLVWWSRDRRIVQICPAVRQLDIVPDTVLAIQQPLPRLRPSASWNDFPRSRYATGATPVKVVEVSRCDADYDRSGAQMHSDKHKLRH